MIPKSVGIHDGMFHADEVTACALLLLTGLIEKNKIYRSRDPLILRECEYLCDVGGIYDPEKKRFDHHQRDYRGHLSSAGMVLKYLLDKGIIEKGLYDYFNSSLIKGVDAHDIGNVTFEDGVCTFSQVIANFLPIEYEASNAKQNKSFFLALDFVLGHLERLQKRYFYEKMCRSIVEEKMKEKSECLIFDQPISWLENFFQLGGERHPALFIIMPKGKEWKLRGIPPSYKRRMEVRYPLPEEWAGLHEKELEDVSHIKGAIFCHKGRFVSIWKTKETALEALHAVLKKRKENP